MVHQDRRMTSRSTPATTAVTDAPPFKYNTAIAHGRTRARMHNPGLFKIYHILTMNDRFIYPSSSELSDPSRPSRIVGVRKG